MTDHQPFVRHSFSAWQRWRRPQGGVIAIIAVAERVTISLRRGVGIDVRHELAVALLSGATLLDAKSTTAEFIQE
jgi:hypothetical protein